MGKTQQKLQSRYRGAILGAAIADALAFPFRNYSRDFLVSVAVPLTQDYEAPRDGFHRAGQYTDDTQGLLAVIDSILEREDLVNDDESAELIVDHLIPLWRDMLVVDADPDMTEAMQSVVRGITPWNEAALPPGYASAGAVTRGIPIGIWDCKSRDQIPGHIETLVSVTHEDARVLAVSAGIAAGIASNLETDELILGDILDRVSNACAVFDRDVADAVLDMPRFLSQTEARAIEMILRVLFDEDHPPRDDGLGDYAVPVLLIALYQFLKTPHDYSTAVDRSIRVGGHVSTIAAVTGAFSGSFNGDEQLPGRLIEGLAESDDIRARVDELFELRRRLLRATRRSSDTPDETIVASDKEGS
jgi:ADP-ribosylglycohydrolase